MLLFTILFPLCFSIILLFYPPVFPFFQHNIPSFLRSSSSPTLRRSVPFLICLSVSTFICCSALLSLHPLVHTQQLLLFHLFICSSHSFSFFSSDTKSLCSFVSPFHRSYLISRLLIFWDWKTERFFTFFRSSVPPSYHLPVSKTLLLLFVSLQHDRFAIWNGKYYLIAKTRQLTTTVYRFKILLHHYYGTVARTSQSTGRPFVHWPFASGHASCWSKQMAIVAHLHYNTIHRCRKWTNAAHQSVCGPYADARSRIVLLAVHTRRNWQAPRVGGFVKYVMTRKAVFFNCTVTTCRNQPTLRVGRIPTCVWMRDETWCTVVTIPVVYRPTLRVGNSRHVTGRAPRPIASSNALLRRMRLAGAAWLRFRLMSFQSRHSKLYTVYKSKSIFIIKLNFGKYRK